MGFLVIFFCRWAEGWPAASTPNLEDQVIFDQGFLPICLDTSVSNCKAAVIVLVRRGTSHIWWALPYPPPGEAPNGNIVQPANNNNNIGATGIVTRSLRKNLEAVPGKHSIDSLQKMATLCTSHIIRKVLQCEAWSLSGGDHRWFKRSTRKKCLWHETYIFYNNNS